MEGNQHEENNQNGGLLMNNTLINTIPGFFRDKDTVDVQFFFEKENKRVGAHKIILASRCDAFKGMFYGGVSDNGEVRIGDVSSEAFITFLRIFYFADVAIPIEQIGEIMHLADKYRVIALTEKCYQYLEHNVPVEHICTGYELAIKYYRGDLALKFEREMKINHKILFKSESFHSCPPEILKRILELDQIMCNDPKYVFEACIAWAKYACRKANLDATKPGNWKQVLDECFYRIPFSLMTPEQILQTFDEYENFFDHKEILDLMYIITPAPGGKKKLNKFKYRYLFWEDVMNVKLTKGMCVKKQEIFDFDASSRCVTLRLDITHNKTDERLVLAGSLEIFEDNDAYKKILLKQNFSFESDSDCFRQRKISFVDPVNIEKGKKYKIQFDFDYTWVDDTFYILRGNSGDPAVVSYCISDVDSSENDVEMSD